MGFALTKGNDFFKFLVAELETGSPSFSADLVWRAWPRTRARGGSMGSHRWFDAALFAACEGCCVKFIVVH
ncbi:hypothetical protein [Sorangium sp. So ce388]|uniref:hypothetical protein n=1 Tax=Sorangium sp. So ce388 TaxID=3133309 RepID=UPI003F5C09AD